jgi:hypothetical protein
LEAAALLAAASAAGAAGLAAFTWAEAALIVKTAAARVINNLFIWFSDRKNVSLLCLVCRRLFATYSHNAVNFDFVDTNFKYF